MFGGDNDGWSNLRSWVWNLDLTISNLGDNDFWVVSSNCTHR